MGLVATKDADSEFLKKTGAFIHLNGWSIDLDKIESLKPFERFLPKKAHACLSPVPVDLIPKTSWFSSLANMLAPGAWNKIRTSVIERDVSCLECGSRFSLEVHEIWEYNQKIGIQTLSGFELLCHLCHETRHLGLASVHGRFEVVFQRLAILNRLNANELTPFYRSIVDKYELRSSRKWTLDLSIIKGQRLKIANSVNKKDGGMLIGRKGATWIIGVEIIPDGSGIAIF
jgi:5-methylcytosine-specific restriction endonuclease McrA